MGTYLYASCAEQGENFPAVIRSRCSRLLMIGSCGHISSSSSSSMITVSSNKIPEMLKNTYSIVYVPVKFAFYFFYWLYVPQVTSKTSKKRERKEKERKKERLRRNFKPGGLALGPLGLENCASLH